MVVQETTRERAEQICRGGANTSGNLERRRRVPSDARVVMPLADAWRGAPRAKWRGFDWTNRSDGAVQVKCAPTPLLIPSNPNFGQNPRPQQNILGLWFPTYFLHSLCTATFACARRLAFLESSKIVPPGHSIVAPAIRLCADSVRDPQRSSSYCAPVS